MMGEVYIVKKEIENPLFYFIDFASFSRNNFLGLSCNKKSYDNLFLFIVITNINALSIRIKLK